MPSSPTTPTRGETFSTLIVEDADGDAELIQDYLDASPIDRFDYARVTCLSDALDYLRRGQFDVIVLDLTLPDSKGAEAISPILDLSKAPIIVLTGANEDEVAAKCLVAGAEDYLRKNELAPRVLTRALGYAIIRRRESELRAIAEARDEYRTALSGGPNSRLALSPIQAVKPEAFRRIVTRYYETLLAYATAVTQNMRRPRENMSDIAESLAKLNATPKDLIAIHAAALEMGAGEHARERQFEIVVEGRLFALEMMGSLLDVYQAALADANSKTSDGVST